MVRIGFNEVILIILKLLFLFFFCLIILVIFLVRVKINGIVIGLVVIFFELKVIGMNLELVKNEVIKMFM